MKKDENGNWPYKLAVLLDRNRDISEEWYVEYYVYSEAIDDLVRKRIKVPKSFPTRRSGLAEAEKMISDTNQVLREGYHLKKDSPTIQSISETEDDLIVALEGLLKTISPTLRSKSAGTYKSQLNKLKTYANGRILTVSEFTTRDAIKFRDYLLLTLLNTPRTANNTLNHMNTLFGHLKERVKR